MHAPTSVLFKLTIILLLAALLEAPSRVLLPSLLPLLSKSPANLLDHTSPHIVRAISQLPSLLSRPSATTTPCPETLGEVREWFREGLRRDLWGPTGLGTLRLRYVVARYLAVSILTLSSFIPGTQG